MCLCKYIPFVRIYAFRLLRLSPWGDQTDSLLFDYEELRALALKICYWGADSELCADCVSPSLIATARPPKGCRCWQRCELRHLKGTDEEVHDSLRSLAMPQVTHRDTACY